MTIHELAAKPENKTDKQGADCVFHGEHYLHVYERYWEPIRERVRRVLEIGVQGGHSMRLWADYFPNAQIYGLDINPQCKVSETGRIHIVIGDQFDQTVLARLAAQGPYDLIIDDGSHRAPHICKSFQGLRESVAPHGWYSIEDMRLHYDWKQRPVMASLFELLEEDLNLLRGRVKAIHHHPMLTLLEYL